MTKPVDDDGNILLPAARWKALGYSPNRWALDHIHTSQTRFNAITTARQVGKTTAGALELDEGMTRPPDSFGRPPLVGLLAPSFGKAELMIDMWSTMIRQAFGNDYIRQNLQKHRIWLPHNGAELQWLSADDPYSVVGFTFSKLIVDESQAVPDLVWEKIRPALDVRDADVYAFGTPDITPSQTWFKSMYIRGQDQDEKDYASFNINAYMNRWMNKETIADAKRNLSTREFRMLYLGEWVDEEGVVFQKYDGALLEKEPDIDDGMQIVMSADLAIHEDFNVIFVADKSTKRVLEMHRWNQTDSHSTYTLIENIYDRFVRRDSQGNVISRPRLIVDASGLGEPMADELRVRGLNITSMKITPGNKLAMIGRLAGDMEHGRIRFYPYPQLIKEIKAFVFHPTPSGKLTAKAASGYNDDCVMSLVLLNEMLGRTARSQHTQTNYLSDNRERAILLNGI